MDCHSCCYTISLPPKAMNNNNQFLTITAALSTIYAFLFYPHSLEALKTLAITSLYLIANKYASHQLTISQPLWYGSFAIDLYNTLLKYLEVKGVCHLHHFTSGKSCDVLIKSLINLIIIDIITLGISFKLQIQIPFLSTNSSKTFHFGLALGLVIFATYVLLKYKVMD